MNKKLKGFTLAEVLIVLTIIGVIAAIVIPPLMNNTNNSEYATAWKKTFAELSQVFSLLRQDNGGTYKNILDNNQSASCSSDSACLGAILSHKLNIVKTHACYDIVSPNIRSNLVYQYNGDEYMLPDGTDLLLSNGEMIRIDCNSYPACNQGSDHVCTFIIVDVNGIKGPNTIGKDIFKVYVTENKLIPAGLILNTNDFNLSDNKCEYGTISGWGCSAYYLDANSINQTPADEGNE